MVRHWRHDSAFESLVKVTDRSLPLLLVFWFSITYAQLVVPAYTSSPNPHPLVV